MLGRFRDCCAKGFEKDENQKRPQTTVQMSILHANPNAKSQIDMDGELTNMTC